MRANIGECGSQSASASNSSRSAVICGASPPRKRGTAGSPVRGLVTERRGFEQHDLVALELARVVLVLPLVLHDLVVDAREEPGPVVVIVLRPALERMIVALRAIELRAEEDARGVLRARDRIAIGAPPVRRRILVGAAARGDELAGEN